MELPKRKTTRLRNYDYSQNGAYFVTICTHNKECILGEIINCRGGVSPPEYDMSNINIKLNSYGEIINKHINDISLKYLSVKIDKYVVMPNHIHLIVMINQDNLRQANGTGNPSPTLSHIIGWFKYQTTKTINKSKNTVGKKLWQRSYHDHIIRNEPEYQKILEYIDTNQLKWELDCYHVK